MIANKRGNTEGRGEDTRPDCYFENFDFCSFHNFENFDFCSLHNSKLQVQRWGLLLEGLFGLSDVAGGNAQGNQ